MSDDKAYGTDDIIGGNLGEDAQNVLRLWRESLELIDPRYHDRRLAKAAARAMTDEVFREALVRAAKERRNDRSYESGEEGTAVWFYENSARDLHVVLPPRAGEIASREPELREVLRSRTAAENGPTYFTDDWNISDPGDDAPIVVIPVHDGTDPNEYHWM